MRNNPHNDLAYILLLTSMSLSLAMPGRTQGSDVHNRAVLVADNKSVSQARRQQLADEKQNRMFQQAQKKLDRTYNRVLQEYATDKLFIEKLRASQKAWLAYRDAYIESRFPEPNKIAEYGSSFRLCSALIVQDFNDRRSKELQQWLDGVQEGECCAGSIHFKK
jgi:uncharacterized protein YecT (DUF1311 family)